MEQKWNKLYFFVKITSRKQHITSLQRMDFESVGRPFESGRAHQIKKKPLAQYELKVFLLRGGISVIKDPNALDSPGGSIAVPQE